VDRVTNRKKRRMPCDVLFEDRRHSGFVLDISPTGLFIQTSAKAKPGDRLDLRLSLPGEARKLPLEAEVVRMVAVPAHLLAVAHGGVGVRIPNPPEAYYDFMETLGVSAGSREAEAESRTAEKSATSAETGGQPPQRYRVRVKQTQGPRSRSLDVTAGSEDEARDRALAEVGEGWQVLLVELK
jgi:Tfp pilus assembly protein PilZ